MRQQRQQFDAVMGDVVCNKTPASPASNNPVSSLASSLHEIPASAPVL